MGASLALGVTLGDKLDAGVEVTLGATLDSATILRPVKSSKVPPSSCNTATNSCWLFPSKAVIITSRGCVISPLISYVNFCSYVTDKEDSCNFRT